MDKKITIPIGEEDIRLFQELIYHNREPFEWRFDGVDIKFIKDEEEEWVLKKMHCCTSYKMKERVFYISL